VSRGRGKGSPALGLGPTAVVHSPDARRSVEAGRDGIDRRDDERLGCKLVEVGGGGGKGSLVRSILYGLGEARTQGRSWWSPITRAITTPPVSK
jgi:hypothetical protein